MRFVINCLYNFSKEKIHEQDSSTLVVWTLL